MTPRRRRPDGTGLARPSRLFGGFALVLAVALTACGTRSDPKTDVTPQVASESGIGGTGIDSGTESGPESGIGGTGLDGFGLAEGGGIGGTGVVGTVTALGSVWVNGVRIAVPDHAWITIEGRPARASAIDVGHVVAVRVGENGAARSVAARHAVAGPVSALSPARAQAVIMGQIVDIADLSPLDWPAVGESVAVSGLRRPDGTIAATRLDPWPSHREWLVRGRPTRGARDGAVQVGGLSARLANSVRLPAGAAIARLSGRFDAQGDPVVTALEETPLNPFGADVQRLLVETWTDATGRPVEATALPMEPGPEAMSLPAASRIVLGLAVDRDGTASRAMGVGAAPGVGHTRAPSRPAAPELAPPAGLPAQPKGSVPPADAVPSARPDQAPDTAPPARDTVTGGAPDRTGPTDRNEPGPDDNNPDGGGPSGGGPGGGPGSGGPGGGGPGGGGPGGGPR